MQSVLTQQRNKVFDDVKHFSIYLEFSGRLWTQSSA